MKYPLTSSKEDYILDYCTKKIVIILGIVMCIAIIAVEIHICGVVGDIIGEILSECKEWWHAGIKIR